MYTKYSVLGKIIVVEVHNTAVMVIVLPVLANISFGPLNNIKNTTFDFSYVLVNIEMNSWINAVVFFHS